MRTSAMERGTMVVSIIALSLAVFWQPAHAQRIHRCVDPEGHVAFTQDSCAYERAEALSHAKKVDEADRDAAARTAWISTHRPTVVEEYHYVVTRYQSRLHMIDARQRACASALADSRNHQIDALDAAERRMYSDPRGGFTIKESLALGQARADVTASAGCGATLRAGRADILAALADPERLVVEALNVKQERQRLSPELPSQLYALAQTVREADQVREPESYDEFSRHARALAEQMRSVQTRYVIPLQIGDHHTLATAVFAACAAIAELDMEWRKERRLADKFETLQAEVSTHRAIRSPAVMDRQHADRTEEALQDAERQHRWAKDQLAAKREATTLQVSEAVSVAADHRQHAAPLNVEARTP
ncbi:MAG TPA: hypothetical protein VMS64_37460 [Candidatus Methylomirabilis sp.]|nr:hypothetical protein [Candidatus Methylomirabilis sp.]